GVARAVPAVQLLDGPAIVGRLGAYHDFPLAKEALRKRHTDLEAVTRLLEPRASIDARRGGVEGGDEETLLGEGTDRLPHQGRGAAPASVRRIDGDGGDADLRYSPSSEPLAGSIDDEAAEDVSTLDQHAGVLVAEIPHPLHRIVRVPPQGAVPPIAGSRSRCDR